MAVASEAGTRRLIGVRAQGMTACPCAQTLVQARSHERLLADGFSESEIERITDIIAKIDTALALPDIFTRDPKQAAQLSQARANAASALQRAEEEWLEARAQNEEAAG